MQCPFIAAWEQRGRHLSRAALPLVISSLGVVPGEVNSTTNTATGLGLMAGFGKPPEACHTSGVDVLAVCMPQGLRINWHKDPTE